LGNPFLLMIAGPNGAGKTTLTRLLRQRGEDFGDYINPDDIADELDGSYNERVRHAQSIADRQRDACIEAKRSFSFETVMSHPSKVDILARAKAAGFFVQLYFVGTEDPQTNIERVALRVAQGGHDVPRDRIVSRWYRTMSLLHSAIATSDRSFVFDNSTTEGFETALLPVLTADRDAHGRLNVSLKVDSPPPWLRRYALAPLGISAAPTH
jgi:predicted ABC-type ATPase